MNLTIVTIPVTVFDQNCRVLVVNDEAIVVDPGGDVEKIIGVLKRLEAKVSGIFLTHSHLDHVGGVAGLLSILGELPLYGSIIERELRESVENQARFFQLGDAGFKNCPEPTIYLADGAELTLNNIKSKVIFVPGHSPGHLTVYFDKISWKMLDEGLYEEGAGESPVLIAGDTLFKGSVGRTDLPGGNTQLLMGSIRAKLMVLPDDTLVLPGHGDLTTIKEERLHNPFLR